MCHIKCYSRVCASFTVSIGLCGKHMTVNLLRETVQTKDSRSVCVQTPRQSAVSMTGYDCHKQVCKSARENEIDKVSRRVNSHKCISNQFCPILFLVILKVSTISIRLASVLLCGWINTFVMSSFSLWHYTQLNANAPSDLYELVWTLIWTIYRFRTTAALTFQQFIWIYNSPYNC